MTPVLFVAAASLGALARHAIHQLGPNWRALLIVNIVGSLLIGVIVDAELSNQATTILAVGFCGALTTYSGFALELRRLPMGQAAGYAAAMVTSTCAAAALGMWLA